MLTCKSHVSEEIDIGNLYCNKQTAVRTITWSNRLQWRHFCYKLASHSAKTILLHYFKHEKYGISINIVLCAFVTSVDTIIFNSRDVNQIPSSFQVAPLCSVTPVRLTPLPVKFFFSATQHYTKTTQTKSSTTHTHAVCNKELLPWRAEHLVYIS